VNVRVGNGDADDVARAGAQTMVTRTTSHGPARGWLMRPRNLAQPGPPAPRLSLKDRTVRCAESRPRTTLRAQHLRAGPKDRVTRKVRDISARTNCALRVVRVRLSAQPTISSLREPWRQGAGGGVDRVVREPCRRHNA